MNQIKRFLPLVLTVLFAGALFAQGPKSIDLQKVKMNANIAKELNAIIKSNSVVLNAMTADQAKAKKMQWREELRDMYGWYNERSDADEIKYIKKQMQKAKNTKKKLTPRDLKATHVVLTPRIVEDKGGKEVEVFEQFTTDAAGLSGKKFPIGSIVLPIKNPALRGLDADAIPSKAQAQKLLQGQRQGVIKAINQLASKQSGGSADENLPSPQALKGIGKQVVGNLTNSVYSPPSKSPTQKPIGYDQNDNPIFEKKPTLKVIGHDEDDQPIYFNPNERPNPTFYKNQLEFEKARDIYETMQDKTGARDYIRVNPDLR